jgi:chemotaxis family two-component system response regulator Rcp1
MNGPFELLLVEDNEGDIELTQRALRHAVDCRLSVVNNGAEAMEFLRKEGSYGQAPTPQLIFLDLNMPRMDGKRFLETVKADAKLRAIPVVMLTSSQSESDIRDCYERFVSCYVVKPFNGKEFTATVQQVVNFWRTTGQLPQLARA